MRLLSNGISEALVATWTGLAVAIPAFIAYRAFRGRLLSLENRFYAAVDDAKQIAAQRISGSAEPRSAQSRGDSDGAQHGYALPDEARP